MRFFRGRPNPHGENAIYVNVGAGSVNASVHNVFSLHFYAFLLLLLCIALMAVGASILFGGRGLESESLDHALSIIMLVVCATYLYIAAETVYGVRGATRILKVLPLAVAVGGIFLGYRFALLLITLYST